MHADGQNYERRVRAFLEARRPLPDRALPLVCVVTPGATPKIIWLGGHESYVPIYYVQSS